MLRYRNLGRRIVLPIIIFLVCASVYVVTLDNRVRGTSPDAHFVSLAQSYLHGQLSVVDNRPLGRNDWAKYKDKWYVSFPPFPAMVILPAVAIFGPDVWDRLFWAVFAGFGPALLYVLLRFLRESGRSNRIARDDLALTFMFAFGTVYFFSSVQGTTWFAAHTVCCALLPLCVLWSVDARKPLLAGITVALCFLTRPHTILVALFFVVEAINSSKHYALSQGEANQRARTGLLNWLSDVDWARAFRRSIVFALPILVAIGVMLWINERRFDDPLVFGHEHLQIKWRYRIDKWGLVNYHYLSKNLAVFFAGLPWLFDSAPFIKVSQHGLALWFTTPHLLLTLWPKRVTPTMVGLYLSAGLIALFDLCYQNSGWVQFGYRFSLDYMVLLFALLALGQRRFKFGFYSLLVFALVVNLFGAVTFDRMKQFYDNDLTQTVFFQPD